MKYMVRSQSGQIGLVVLLIGAVLVTLGLGVASQSVLESKTARQESESSQAFNAAEQGVERAMSDPNLPSTSFDQGNYHVTVTSAPQTDTYRVTLATGQSAQLNLVGVTTVTFDWTGAGTTELLVSQINDDGSAVQRSRLTSSGDSITVTGTIARIKALKAGTTITATLQGSSPLPPQGYIVDSTATRTGSGETRAISVSKSNAQASSLFDYALFAGQGGI